MKREWLGVITALATAAAFGACNDTIETTPTSSSSSTTTTATNSGGSAQGGGGSGAAAGNGGNAGQGGQGGGDCTNPPMPTNPINCGGTAASVGNGGGNICILSCDDAANDSFEVSCDSQTGMCECKVNDQTLCTCSQTSFGCSNHCCPAPWDNLTLTGSGGGGVGGAGTSSVATGNSTGNSTGSN